MIKKASYFFLVLSATMLVSCSAKETDSSTNLPVVSVVKPVSGSLQESVSFSGYVEAEAMIYIIPMVSGTIKEYPVKIGENVKEGTIIARIDSEPFKQQMLQAKAAYMGYENTFTRIEKLYKTNTVSLQEYESAKAQRDAAKASYDLAVLQLSYTDVKAPVSGTVLAAPLAVGAVASSQSPVAVIADLQNQVVRLEIPEKYFDLFYKNDNLRAEVYRTVTNLSENSLEQEKQILADCTINAVAPFVKSTSKTFQTIFEIQDTGEKFKPGMFVKVRVYYKELENASLLPAGVLTLDGSAYIYNEEDSTCKKIQPEILGEDETYIAVPEKYKDTVFILEGQNSIFDGQKVRIIENENPQG